jgi:hypothetical protein
MGRALQQVASSAGSLMHLRSCDILQSAVCVCTCSAEAVEEVLLALPHLITLSLQLGPTSSRYCLLWSRYHMPTQEEGTQQHETVRNSLRELELSSHGRFKFDVLPDEE